ncbi:MAG: hypothetical protein KatS3mg105_0021 [Gemmatales bacterium]|nr:MAG: hypothetical protein KatS3mg105_0021 [Gemmatales bacterium]
MSTSLPMGFADAVRQLAALGFAYVDIVGEVDRKDADREALADSGLIVSCAAIGRHLPEGCSVDGIGEARQKAVKMMKEQLADAARLGATCAYILPGRDESPQGLKRFADSCKELVDDATGRMIRLCLEHFPGKALDSVRKTIEFMEKVENLYLLLDIGHCLICNEEPAEMIEWAGNRLGYVHLDDNDGEEDLHWPLLTGRLTRKQLQSAFQALGTVHYRGVVALEFNPVHPDPVSALAASKNLVEGLLAESFS